MNLMFFVILSIKEPGLFIKVNRKITRKLSQKSSKTKNIMYICLYVRNDVFKNKFFRGKMFLVTLGQDVVGDVVEQREVGQLLLHHLLRLHLHHLSAENISFNLKLKF